MGMPGRTAGGLRKGARRGEGRGRNCSEDESAHRHGDLSCSGWSHRFVRRPMSIVQAFCCCRYSIRAKRDDHHNQAGCCRAARAEGRGLLLGGRHGRDTDGEVRGRQPAIAPPAALVPARVTIRSVRVARSNGGWLRVGVSQAVPTGLPASMAHARSIA